MGKQLQLEAALRKNYLLKKHNIRASFCELFSPLFLIWLLFYGYGMSDVFSFGALNYASIFFQIPGEFASLIGDSTSTGTLNSSLDGGAGGSFSSSSSLAAGAGDLGSLYNLRSTLDKLLRGPLPPPSFDAFVLASNITSSNIAPGVYDEIIGDTDYGRAFGNLITLGTLHVTPAGPEADAFVAFAEKNTATFGKGYFRHRVHSSEERAVSWIDEHASEERAWVLIVLTSVQEGDVDYTLRFNYSTVPHTG